MKFIDTHSHVLAHWDDGAPDWDVSLDMLRQGEKDGIGEIVCTPHIMSSSELEREDEILALYEDLKHRAADAGISIQIHIGSELYVQPDFQLDRRIATLAGNGKYFLLEFPMNMMPEFVAKRFFDIITGDRVPIIAHPERNAGIISSPQKAFDLVKRGALLQVTAGSLLGVFGTQVKAVALKLMDANLVHIVATDAHDLKKRPLKLREAYDFVIEHWGSDRANALFYENPNHIIRGEAFQVDEPIPFTVNAKPSLSDQIKSFFKR